MGPRPSNDYRRWLWIVSRCCAPLQSLPQGNPKPRREHLSVDAIGRMGGAMGAACFFHRREEGVLTHAREEPKAIQRTGVGQLTTASMPRRASFAECSETFEKIQTL